MSTKSKTGAKLVDSIRKSKTGAVASKTSSAREATDKPKTSTPARSRREEEEAPSIDSSQYSSRSRRVWPD